MPDHSQFVTAADIEWSDGTPFSGFLLLVLALPSGYTAPFIRGYQGVRLPPRVKIPIIEGKLKGDRCQVWRTGAMVPPTTRWCAYWYDETGTQIATGATLFAVTTAEHTIAVPTLTVPTAPVECVSLDPPAGAASPASLYPTVEEVSGTKDGSNKTFTVSEEPRAWLGLYRNGALLKIDSDYTLSGSTITIAATVPAPLSTESLQAVYWS